MVLNSVDSLVQALTNTGQFPVSDKERTSADVLLQHGSSAKDRSPPRHLPLKRKISSDSTSSSANNDCVDKRKRLAGPWRVYDLRRSEMSSFSAFATKTELLGESERSASPVDSGYESSCRSYSDPSTPSSYASFDASPSSESSQSSSDVAVQSGLPAVRRLFDTAESASMTASSSECSTPVEFCDAEISIKLRRCLWLNCSSPSLGNEELIEHVLREHIAPLEQQPATSKFACRWTGCKAFDLPAKTYSWLHRHALEKHGGPRPYACVVDGCALRFSSKGAVERHVNGHFLKCDTSGNNVSGAAPAQSNGVGGHVMRAHLSRMISGPTAANGDSLERTRRLEPIRTRSHAKITTTSLSDDAPPSSSVEVQPPVPTPSVVQNACSTVSNHRVTAPALIPSTAASGLVYRRVVAPPLNGKSRVHVKRMCLISPARRDFLDARSVQLMQHEIAQRCATGAASGSRLTFQAEITCTRADPAGNVSYFVNWQPQGMIPSSWIPKEQYQKTMTVHARQLLATATTKR